MISLYRKSDRYLLGLLFFPLLAYLLFTKWAVVDQLGTTELTGRTLFEFMRAHIGYYLMMFCWALVMLINTSRYHGIMRAVALLGLIYFSVVDLGYSASIQVTGVLAPYDLAYYAGMALGTLGVSVTSTTLITMIIIPTLFTIFPLFKKILTNGLPKQKVRYRNVVGTLGIASLLVACVGPRGDIDGERSHMQPSYMYQISAFIDKTFNPKQPPIANTLEKQTIQVELPKRRPNVVIIALESVRAEALGVYNNNRTAVTPYMNRLAQQSITYERAYTVVPHTSKALAAINCGWAPMFRHPIYESSMGTPSDCLASVLDNAGYSTVFFQSPTEHFENRRGLVEQFGFKSFYAAEQMPSEGFELVNYFGYEDNVMLKPSEQWLEKQDKPFFAFYLTGTTHHPYWAPSRYEQQDFIKGENLPVAENEYLNSLYYLDRFVESLINQYKSLGLYDNTYFVILGDHGESIAGQHGRFQHNVSLHEDTLKIPLIIHSSQFAEQTRVQSVVNQVDVMPTLLSLMGFELKATLPGRVVTGDNQPAAPVFSACWYDDWCAARVDHRYKYIYNFNEKPDELYDLVEDPIEAHNIAPGNPELIADFKRETLRYYDANLSNYDRFYTGLDPNYRNKKAQTVSREMRMFTKDDQKASRLAMGEPEHH